PAPAPAPAPPLQPPGGAFQPDGSPPAPSQPTSPPQSPAGLFHPPGSAANADAGAGAPLPTGPSQHVAPSESAPQPSASAAFNATPDAAGRGSGSAGQPGQPQLPEHGADGEPEGAPAPPNADANSPSPEGAETPSPLREHIAPIAELSQTFSGLPGMSGLSNGLNEIPGISTTGDMSGRWLAAASTPAAPAQFLGRALQLPDEESPATSQRGRTRTPHSTTGHATSAPRQRPAGRHKKSIVDDNSQSTPLPADTTHSPSGVAHDVYHDLVDELGNGDNGSDSGPGRIVYGEDVDISDVPYQVSYTLHPLAAALRTIDWGV
ncbi:hypothetical protein KUF71_022235, partial [Frankliniella fusca]